MPFATNLDLPPGRVALSDVRLFPTTFLIFGSAEQPLASLGDRRIDLGVRRVGVGHLLLQLGMPHELSLHVRRRDQRHGRRSAVPQPVEPVAWYICLLAQLAELLRHRVF